MHKNKQNFLNENNIPNELKKLKQWVLWKKVRKNGKLTKEPFQTTNKHAKVNDPTTWTDFETAKAANNGNFNGIGFMFAEDDGFTGIDIDAIKDKDGNQITKIIESGKIVNDFAQKIVDQFASYTEITQSGNGLHIIIYGKKPEKGCKKVLKEKECEIEMYSQSRFFVMTGNVFNNRPIQKKQNELLKLHNEVFGSNGQVPKQSTTNHNNNNVDIKMVYERINRSKQANIIQNMLNGGKAGKDWSFSERDQSLCNHLAFFSNKDPYIIDQIIRNNPVYRKKWDNPHYEDGTTYGQETINKALQIKDEYDPSYNSDKNLKKEQKSKKSSETTDKKNKWQILTEVLEQFSVKLKFNELTKVLEATRDGEKTELKLLTADIMEKMESYTEVPNISTNKINEMLLSSRYCEKYNPVNDFIKSIPQYNGKNNFDELMDYIHLPGDESREFFKSMLKKHFIRALKCAIEKEYTHRMVLNFHGPQEIGKSLLIEWFIPIKTLFNSENIDLNDKDTHLALGQYLFISLEELDQLNKRELSKLKAFISKGEIKKRLPYGRFTEQFPRIATFFGSTNKTDILADVQNSRWIFLKVKSIDYVKYMKNLNPWDLWAEAYQEYKQNPEAGELTAEEKQERDKRNDQEFLEDTNEREILLKHFSEEEPTQGYTAVEIQRLIEFNNYPVRINSYQLRRELHRLFGEPELKKIKGRTGRFYFLNTDLKDHTESYENKFKDGKAPF
jgi:primase-polymerase (primpol)-like protein